jgi:hypothetical protein
MAPGITCQALFRRILAQSIAPLAGTLPSADGALSIRFSEPALEW